MWDLEGDVLEVGSRWHSAELLSCCVAGEGRTQLGEGKERARGLAVFLLYRPVAGQGAAESDPAGMQGPLWF